jgi:3-hydroxyisobutyrate dehydrogenase-like beta-hydroxyacid dehydrogenase
MIAKAIEAHGGKFVACPVFGAPAMTEIGQLICVLAGPKGEVEKSDPILQRCDGKSKHRF